MRDAIAAYVKRVKEWEEHCRGNEQATKKSLIEPLFSLLGYDVSDPRECVPEHKADFGPYKGVKAVDYAFFKDGAPIFFVEAKHVDKKLAGHDEQLATYFAKAPGVKLGILTNGVHWRFYTDLEAEHVMDKKAFLEWQVLSDEPPPWDFLTLLQKSQYNPELIRTFAERRYQQNLLVEEMSRLLEPAPEFIRLAIAKIEMQNLTEKVVQRWKPLLKAAIGEWAKQHRLSSVLSEGAPVPTAEGAEGAKPGVVTTQAELEAFATVQRLLGPDRPVEYEDKPLLFKIHLPGKRSCTVCRLLNLGEKTPSVSLPLTPEQLAILPPSLTIIARGKHWSRIALTDITQLEQLAPALCLAWDQHRAAHATGAQEEEPSEE